MVKREVRRYRHEDTIAKLSRGQLAEVDRLSAGSDR
jgi:hypothetical protein